MSVYAIGKDNNLFETMTKEEIVAAIEEAAAGGSLAGFDNCAFVSCVRELNKNAAFSFWVGTQAEYNALPEYEKNVLYLISNDSMSTELPLAINSMRAEVSAITEATSRLSETVNTYQNTVEQNNEAFAAAVEEINEAFGATSDRMAEVEEELTAARTDLQAILNQNEPQIIFVNGSGSTTCETNEPITKFREIRVVFLITDANSNLTMDKKTYQESFFVEDINGEIWLRGCRIFSYSDGGRWVVNTVARFGVENNESNSVLTLGTRSTIEGDKDWSNRFLVGITKIYGIGRRV